MKVGYYLDSGGGGWYFTGRGWIYVRRRTAKGTWVPAGRNNYERHWASVKLWGPFQFVSGDYPDETWRDPTLTDPDTV